MNLSKSWAELPIKRILGVILYCCFPLVSAHANSLPSWNQSSTKQAIINFVERTTNPDSSDFVPVPERVAVFDNDGTLWSEQPLYFQAFYILDQIKALAPEHPEWKEEEPFASALKRDFSTLMNFGHEELIKLVTATNGNVSADQFQESVRNWLKTAKHPTTGKSYTSMVYQPMLELLEYLRSHEYKTFIVSGGGIDFIRVFSENCYGIPPEQVVGSSNRASYQIIDGRPTIIKDSVLSFYNDGPGKPAGIHQHIGRRPVMAFGNSDGDFQMLEWTTAGTGPRLGVLLNHTDHKREWAYDRNSAIGQLSRGLDEAAAHGWFIIDMASDWAVIHPEDE